MCQMDESESTAFEITPEELYVYVNYDSEENFEEQLPESEPTDNEMSSSETVDSPVEQLDEEHADYIKILKDKRSNLVANKRKMSPNKVHRRRSLPAKEPDSDTNTSFTSGSTSGLPRLNQSINIPVTKSCSRRHSDVPKKRLRYSDTSSLNTYSTSSYRHTLPGNFNASGSLTWNMRNVDLAKPLFRNYQLLGDSQFVRFAEQILGYQLSNRDPRQISYCVSGQKIRQLDRLVQSEEYPIHSNIIVLIGTNDIVYQNDLSSMMNSYMCLLMRLKRKANRIVLVTLPPVARFEDDESHWVTLMNFNKFIIEQRDDEQVFVVDAGKMYLDYNRKTNKALYESVYGNTTREDLVHLNKDGFYYLKASLDIQYFQKYTNFSPVTSHF